MPGVMIASAVASASCGLSNWWTAPRGDAEHLIRADVDGRAVHRPGEQAFEAVDRLLVAVVAVGGSDLHAGRHVELEHGDRPAGLLAFDQEPDRQRADLDLFAHARCHGSAPLPVVKSFDGIMADPISS